MTLGALATPMVSIPAQTFWMGSDDNYPEERPRHEVHVPGFRIDCTPVTNADFAAFVDATGYVTLAERTPDASLLPRVPRDRLVPGSAVFHRPRGPVDLRDPLAWWRYVPGADWRHPEGPGSDIATRRRHPVVHVAWEDARAFAEWAGKALPTEAEWELAARGRTQSAEFAWGTEFAPGGRLMANVWIGEFPALYERRGRPGTQRVGSYPPNDWGLFDMIGNVWEWTSDPWTSRHSDTPQCCALASPGGDGAPAVVSGTRVAKGGSFLCAANYCARYRPAARIGQAEDSPTAHIGFRCVIRP